MKKKVEAGMAVCCDTREEAADLLKQLRDMGYSVRRVLSYSFSKDRAYVIPALPSDRDITSLAVKYLHKHRSDTYRIVRFSDLEDDISGGNPKEEVKSRTVLPIVTDTAILQKAIREYGESTQVDMAIEEMSELTKALLKYRRANKKPAGNLSLELTDIYEETADVIIMMYQLLMIYGGEDAVQGIISQKVKRLAKRLDADE